jgi:hypothetical protein
MKHPEYELQKQICKWLQYQHRSVLFLSDTIAAVKLTIPQGARNKAIQKEGFKVPDLLILEPNDKYHGLFIELKIESPYKKNGELKASEHLEGQLKCINQLKERGYYSCFSWSFEMTKEIIEKYLKNQL